MLDPENNGTVSPESLWRMTGGSQIGNCIKSFGTQNHQKRRSNLRISRTRVLKNDMGSVKCPFRRACAVEWFGQISRLGSSVASIWYMATDFGRRFVTWAHYTTWAQSRDFRGRKLFENHCHVEISWFFSDIAVPVRPMELRKNFHRLTHIYSIRSQ